MLNLALVGVLAGSLLTAVPDGDRDKDKDKDRNRANSPAPTEQTAAPVESVVAPEVPIGLVAGLAAAADDPDRPITTDTYANGRPVGPIMVWANYGWGKVNGVFNLTGDPVDGFPLPVGVNGSFVPVAGFELNSTRVQAGAEVRLPIRIMGLSIGAGAQLTVARNRLFDPADNLVAESEFGIQGVKAWGALRGRVLGIHAGYIFDMGDEPEPGDAEALRNSDQRGAAVFGVDFDYPSEIIRLGAGFDYYSLEGDPGDVPPLVGTGELGGDDILFWTMVLGVRIRGFVELGAALHIRSQLSRGPLHTFVINPATLALEERIQGGHVGSIAPYARISPGFIPLAIYVKGAVHEEYTDYGFGLGGANEFNPDLGFTVGLVYGFE